MTIKNPCNFTKLERSEYKIDLLHNISSSIAIWKDKQNEVEEVIYESNNLIDKIKACPECLSSIEDLSSIKSIKNIALTLDLEGTPEDHLALKQAYTLYSYMQNEFEYCQ